MAAAADAAACAHRLEVVGGKRVLGPWNVGTQLSFTRAYTPME
jgi:hypothetical protein